MSESKLIKELKEKVAISCRIIGNRGVTRGSFGHVSARIPGTKKILIKAKGPAEEALEFAGKRDIIMIDIDGKTLEAPEGLEAPQETEMHLAVFRARPEVMSVIHSHPDWVVALTASEKPLLPIYAAYNPPGMRLVLDGIPVYPRSVTVVNEALGKDFMRYMGDKKVCLLRGHGMTTAGKTVEEATSVSLNAFELARLNYMAYAIGTPKSVPEEDIREYQSRWEKGTRKRDKEIGEPSDWRYNKKLLKKG